MVMLNPFHGLRMFGDGSDGAGPVNGMLAGTRYDYTNWNITGAITLGSSTGVNIYVYNNLTISGSGTLSLYGSSGGVLNWGAADDGDVPTGGAACGVTISRYETIYTQDYWSGWNRPGGGRKSGGFVPGRGRLNLFVGGVVSIENTGAISIIGTGIKGDDKVAADGEGGGGGGLICIISGSAIRFSGFQPGISAIGGAGGNADGSHRAGAGGGGGAIILMAPSITATGGTVASFLSAAGGAAGTGDDSGSGNGYGGGGSFGAGGDCTDGVAVEAGNAGQTLIFDKFNPLNPLL